MSISKHPNIVSKGNFNHSNLCILDMKNINQLNNNIMSQNPNLSLFENIFPQASQFKKKKTQSLP